MGKKTPIEETAEYKAAYARADISDLTPWLQAAEDQLMYERWPKLNVYERHHREKIRRDVSPIYRRAEHLARSRFAWEETEGKAQDTAVAEQWRVDNTCPECAAVMPPIQERQLMKLDRKTVRLISCLGCFQLAQSLVFEQHRTPALEAKMRKKLRDAGALK